MPSLDKNPVLNISEGDRSPNYAIDTYFNICLSHHGWPSPVAEDFVVDPGQLKSEIASREFDIGMLVALPPAYRDYIAQAIYQYRVSCPQKPHAEIQAEVLQSFWTRLESRGLVVKSPNQIPQMVLKLTVTLTGFELA